MDKQDWLKVRDQIEDYREESRSIGICTAIILTHISQLGLYKEMLIVLKKHKPTIEVHAAHWWPTANPEGVEIRLSIIDTIIAELEQGAVSGGE